MSRSTAVAWTVLALAATGPVGCRQAPEASDPAQARLILRQALDAWKNGEPPESLKQADPAVTAVDRQWRRGVKLLDFEIAADDRPSGFDVQFTATLAVQDAAGKKSTEKAVYNVSTTPARVVVRTEPGG